MTDTLVQQAAPAVQTFGFIDVRGTSADWPEVPKVADTDAYLSNRRRLPLPSGPITVDRVTLAAGAAGQCRLAGDEFVLAVEGDVSLEQSGVRCDLAAGEAGVLVRELSLSWRSDGGAVLIVVRCTGGGAAGATTPIKIDLDPAFTPSNPPAAEVLLGETPQCRGHCDYRTTTGEFLCGVWDSTPYQRRLINFGHYELMRVLDGAVTFVDTNGREGRFKAGDVVLFVQGGGASWESWTYVKKIYATYRPMA